MAKWSKIPKHVKIEPVNFNNINAEWSIPIKTETKGVILYVHGGGYVAGSVQTHRAFVAQVAKKAKTKLLSVDYRLAPEHPFPAAIEDGINAYKWLLEQGYNSSQIVLMGDSAGGGLAIGLALKIRDLVLPLPIAVVALSPWVDLLCEGETMLTNQKTDNMANKKGAHFFAISYAKESEYKNPYASPLYANLKGFPKILIQVSNTEILYNDATRFNEKALSEGVDITLDVWNKMPHVWQMFSPILPEARLAIRDIGTFIQECLPKN
jgi:acetyl esterase/lipase